MTRMLAALMLAAAGAAAQEAAPAAPPTQVEETAQPAPSAPEPKVPESAPAPEPEAKKEEPKAKPEPKAEPKHEPKPEAKPAPEEPVQIEFAKKPAPSKPASAERAVAAPDLEWVFAKSAAEDVDVAVQEAAIDELRLFVRRHPDAPQAPEALHKLAELRQKRGDWQPAMAGLLRLLYEYPGTKTGLRAKSDHLSLVDKKASRKQRQALNDLVRLPETSDRADRLSALWLRVVEQAPDAIYESAAEEIREFFVRFPGHKDADKLQAGLARLHASNYKPQAALLAWRRLLALYPDSALRPQAMMAIGELYADSLRDPKKAIDSYQELVDKHPGAAEVLPALERSAQLFDGSLRQYDLAVEMHEKVIATFPKTPASLKALKAVAKLQRDRLSKPDDAVKTLMRLSQMHGGIDGVEALLQAADIARRDLKDYARQAELLRKVADDYAAAKEAPQALYDAAYVYEGDLKDNAKAIEVFKEVASKFPSHKLASKSSDRAAKLEAK